MNTCQNCGKLNTPETNFCRFCGTRFHLQPQRQPQPPVTQEPYTHTAPRPYSWKTDEFQTNNEARHTAPGLAAVGTQQPLAPQNQYQPQPATLAYSPAGQFIPGFRCPNCMSTYQPRMERRISTGGWITFAALLVFFFPLFWIGLMIKEDVLVCQGCNSKLTS